MPAGLLADRKDTRPVTSSRMCKLYSRLRCGELSLSASANWDADTSRCRDQVEIAKELLPTGLSNAQLVPKDFCQSVEQFSLRTADIGCSSSQELSRWAQLDWTCPIPFCCLLAAYLDVVQFFFIINANAMKQLSFEQALRKYMGSILACISIAPASPAFDYGSRYALELGPAWSWMMPVNQQTQRERLLKNQTRNATKSTLELL
eukprot:6179258-Amphidinium_carterae.1